MVEPHPKQDNEFYPLPHGAYTQPDQHPDRSSGFRVQFWGLESNLSGKLVFFFILCTNFDLYTHLEGS